MKPNSHYVACVALCLVLVTGCGRTPEKPAAGAPTTPVKPAKPTPPAVAPATTEQKPVGALQSTIDYATGAASIRAGQKAGQQIRAISEERDRQLQESLESSEP